MVKPAAKVREKKKNDVCLVGLVWPQVKTRDDNDNASVFANRFRLWEGCQSVFLLDR